MFTAKVSGLQELNLAATIIQTHDSRIPDVQNLNNAAEPQVETVHTIYATINLQYSNNSNN